MAEDDSIFRQILRDADLYQPSVYDLLTFYSSLQTVSEPLDGQFVPMTTVQSYEQERTLIFAVGLIPPSANVSGRLLDRSATIARLADPDEGPGNESTPDYPPPEFVVRPDAGLVEQGRLFSKFGPRQNRQETAPRPHLGVDIAAPAGSEVRAAAGGTIVSVSPDGVRDSYGNTVVIEHDDGSGSLYAHLSGFAPNVSVGTRVEGGTVIGFVGQTSAPKVMQDGPHLHFEVMASVARGGAPKFDGVIANRNTPQRLDPERWLPAQGRAVASQKEENFTIPFEGDSSPATNWAASGSSSANKAQQTISVTANTSLSRENLGDRLSKLQTLMILKMRAAIEQISKTPPLRLLVNPRSFRTSHEKVIADSGWGREGPIIEFWGENQDTIEASGKIAAFFSLDVQTGTGPGLTRTARQFSTSYQNLMSLFLLYKNNGGVYIDPTSDSRRSRNLSVLGSVYIYYDGILYIGSFDNFSINETEEEPFSLEYSFSFKVRASFILDHLDDPQYTYGRPQMSNTTTPGLRVGSSDSIGSSGFGGQLDPNVALPSVDDALAGDLGDLG